jgi:hypothetical protein
VGRKTLEKLAHLKASVRAKVEHPFHVVKNLFRHLKTRYRGLGDCRTFICIPVSFFDKMAIAL